MRYIINSEKLTEREKELIQTEAEDKLIAVLSELVESSNNKFLGDMRFGNFDNAVLLSISDQIDKIDNLLREVDSKSIEEQRSLAKDFGVADSDTIDSNTLQYELVKAIYKKRNEIMSKSLPMAREYNFDQGKTFRNFVKDQIKLLDIGLAKEKNIDVSGKYEFLRNNFAEIDKELDKIVGYVDLFLYPISLYNDSKAELFKINLIIQDNQTKLSTSSDYNEIIRLRDQMIYDKQKRKSIEQSIAIQRDNILDVFNKSDIKIDFLESKIKVLNNLEFIRSNLTEAYNKGVLDINEGYITNCINAFTNFYSFIINRESDFNDYVEANDIIIEDERAKTLTGDGEVKTADGLFVNSDIVSKQPELASQNDNNDLHYEAPVVEEQYVQEDDGLSKENVAEQSAAEEYQLNPNSLLKPRTEVVEETQDIVSPTDEQPKIEIVENTSPVVQEQQITPESNAPIESQDLQSQENSGEVYTSPQAAKILAEDEAFLKTMNTKDKLLELYNQADEKFQLKVKSIQDILSDKISQSKAKAKQAIAESKIFKKIKQLTDNIANESFDSNDLSVGRGAL